MRLTMQGPGRRLAGRLQRAILAISLAVSILPVPSTSAVSAICFGAPSPSEVVLGAVSPAAGALGQFGGDSAPDLLTIGSGSDVALRTGNGSGGFSFVLNESVATAPSAIAAGKIDGDAHDDFLAGGVGSAKISVRLGNGAGGFTTKSDIPVVTDPTTIVMGNLNGDSFLDFVSGGPATDVVSVRFGDGSGGFPTASDVVVTAPPSSIAVADLNGDGLTDFATVGSGAPVASIRFGLPGGGFTPGADVPVGDAPTGIAIGDVNGDGRLDLVVANQGTNNVSIRLGQAGGTFAPAAEPEVPVGNTLTAASPFWVVLADFNGDGKLDFATSNLGQDSLSIRLGDGLGGFDVPSPSEIPLPSASQPAFVLASDLNNDGAADLVALSSTYPTASVRLNCRQNAAPVIAAPGGQTVAEDGTLTLSAGNNNRITVADPDAGSNPARVTLAATQGTLTLPGSAGLTFTTGSASASPVKTFTGTLTDVNTALNGLQFSPDANYTGTALLNVAVDDLGKTGTGGTRSSTSTVPITVTPVNDTPTARADSYIATGQTTLTIPAPGVLANDSDQDSATLTAVKLTNPGNGSVTLDANGGFQYTPTGTFTGTDSFTYQTSDGTVPSSPATVTITVNAAVGPGATVGPSTASDTYTVTTGQALTVAAPGLLANDISTSTQALTAAKTSEPAHGTLVVDTNGGFTYTPKPGFFGTDTFSYRASEGAGQSNPTVVLINVVPTACGPRPQVRTNLATGGGKLQVHIEATPQNNQQNNGLKQVTFGTLANATVTYDSQPVTSGQTITLPAATFAADFTVQRTTAGQATTVPFTIVDACGTWPSFVGGGAGATGF